MLLNTTYSNNIYYSKLLSLTSNNKFLLNLFYEFYPVIFKLFSYFDSKESNKSINYYSTNHN